MRILAAAAFVAFSSIAHAVPLTVPWDANPPEEEVTQYCVYDNMVQLGCTAGLSLPIDLPFGTHSITATAHNRYGLSSDHSVPLQVTIIKPSVVQKVNITVTQKVTIGQ